MEIWIVHEGKPDSDAGFFIGWAALTVVCLGLSLIEQYGCLVS